MRGELKLAEVQNHLTWLISFLFCQNCGVHPKFVENGHVHPYCGRRCATEYKRSSQQATVAGSFSRSSAKCQPQNTWTKIPAECSLRDCKNQGRPQFGGFCSDVHQQYVFTSSHRNLWGLLLYQQTCHSQELRQSLRPLRQPTSDFWRHVHHLPALPEFHWIEGAALQRSEISE